MPDRSRRMFLATSSSVAGLAALNSGCAAPAGGAPRPAPTPPPAPAAAPGADATFVAQRVDLVLTVNDVSYPMQLDPRVTLLDALRERIGLTGTKKGCDQGQCGACTVHLDGRRVLACLTLAASVGARRVTTIEGLATSDGRLHPMQQAFVDHDALQCGYCTPGQIMSAVACVSEGHARTADEIREYMSGNLCRCAAYPNIVAAVEQAREKVKT